MKKVFSVVLFTIISSLFFLSCDKNDESQVFEKKEINQVNSEDSNTFFKEDEPKFFLIYVDWDEWGRSSKKCRSWGLCNYRGCSFCCVSGGEIVSCDSGNRMANSGKMIIDKLSKEGFLYIELDPIYEEQAIAINNKKTLYIDENLSDLSTVIYQGEYQLDGTVGRYGGYKIPVTML